MLLANIRLIACGKNKKYFCSIEPCMLLCFKNNLLACDEALMQFAEPNNDRMSVTVFFCHLKMPPVLKLLKFCNFSEEGLFYIRQPT